MDEWWIWLLVLFGGVVAALPIVAIAMAAGTRAQLTSLRARLDRTERELAALRLAPPPVVPALVAPAAEIVPSASEFAGEIAESAAIPPATAGVEPPPDTVPTPPATTLEERIGIAWFTRIGAAVLVLGTGYFFKYAVDNAWVGPWGRIAAGAVAAVGTLALAERLRRTSAASYVHALLGVGLALAYVTSYALYGFYALVPLTVSFAAIVAVSLVAAALAVRHHAGIILAFALVAALANPVLLSTHEDRLFALAAYVLLVTSGALAVALRERFARVPWIAFAGSVVLGLGWAMRFFEIHEAYNVPTAVPVAAGAYHPLDARIVPLLAVAGLLAQWLAFAEIAVRNDFRAVNPAWLKFAALAFAQCAFAGIVYDHDGLVGLVAPLVALVAIASLRADDERRALASTVPVTFAVLAMRAYDRDAALPWGLLSGAYAWGALHLGTIAFRLRKHPPDRLVVLTAGGVALGAVGVLVIGAPDEVPTLKALGAALAGTGVFALGAPLVARGPLVRPFANALLGVALALFATTLGLAFSGVTLTVLWAALAGIVAYLAGRSRDPHWRLAALTLYALLLARVVYVDALAASHARALFIASRGARGEFLPPLVFNERALALAATTLSLLLGARELGRDRNDTPGLRVSATLAAGGYLALLALCITEASRAVLTVPVLPSTVLDREEFSVWVQQAMEALAAQRNAQAVAATLTMGVVGTVILAVGFLARNALHRLFGIAILGLTVAKLLLWDIWNLPRLMQVIVLIATGVLLLGAGLLYARFGKRLLGWIGVAAVFLVLLVRPSPAMADVNVAHFRSRVAVVADNAGLVSFRIPPWLYAASLAESSLDDVRIVATDGREVPWMREPATPPVAPETRVTTVLDPVTLDDGSAQITFDLEREGLRHDSVEPVIESPDFVRSVRIESSEDRLHWGLLGTDRVYRLASAGAYAEKTRVQYPVSASRYVRLTFAPSESHSPLSVTGGTVWLRPVNATVVEGEVALIATGVTHDATGHRTVYAFDVETAGVPLVAVVLAVTAPRSFERAVRVGASGSGTLWVPSGGGWIYRIGDADSGVRVPVSTHLAHLKIEVTDGDDAPLIIEHATGVYAIEQLLLDAPSAGDETLYIGDARSGAPAYDLASRRTRDPVARVGTARVGALILNPGFNARDTVELPWTEQHRSVIGAALAVLVGLMAVWAVRVLRTSN